MKKHNQNSVSLKEMIWAFISSFFGIFIVAFLNYNIFEKSDFIFIVGSFGASACLIYGAIKSPFSQPRNLIVGHIISAFLGVLVYKLFSFNLALASSLAVSSAIFIMHLTKTFHPPGGAGALIAIIGSEYIHKLGFYYVLIPVGLGAFILLFVALIFNNIGKDRKYPVSWF